MSQPRAQRTRILLLVLTCLASVSLFGCAQLFERTVEKVSLTPDAPAVARNTIVLDIVVARRSLGDSLIRLLWDDVQEMGVVETTRQRRLLNGNGFRLGVAGSSVPSALQTILRESVQEAGGDSSMWNAGRNQLPGSSQVTLFDGQDTLFEVTNAVAKLSFTEVDELGEESSEPREFENARCVVRVTARRLQEGWIKLKFLPEIHHGANANRAVVGETGLQFKATQRIQPLYKYQFEVTLNTGEIAIVGAQKDNADRAGSRFLTVDDATDHSEKLITVRFVGTSSVAGESQSPHPLK